MVIQNQIIQHSLMQMRIYTTNVISHGNYTPKMLLYTGKNCFWRINGTRNDIRAIDTNFQLVLNESCLF